MIASHRSHPSVVPWRTTASCLSTISAYQKPLICQIYLCHSVIIRIISDTIAAFNVDIHPAVLILMYLDRINSWPTVATVSGVPPVHCSVPPAQGSNYCSASAFCIPEPQPRYFRQTTYYISRCCTRSLLSQRLELILPQVKLTHICTLCLWVLLKFICSLRLSGGDALLLCLNRLFHPWNR